MDQLSVVGKPLPPLNAGEKVSGAAMFTDDLNFPGMLYGRILRSPHPHAKILEIDTTEAEKLSGVKAVITAKDTLQIKFIHLGGPFEDKLPLQTSKVRYVGDEVAAVAATSEGIAEKAIRLIRVDYEPLDPVFDPELAMKEGAPQIHNKKGNVVMQTDRVFGDVDKAFLEADLVVEDQFETLAVAHCNMEPRCAVARVDAKGVLNIWSSTQAPYFVRKELSHVLGIPLSKVRVMEINVGGGFGARSKVCEDEAITAILALKTGRPVKIAFSREEEFAATRTRIPFKTWIRQAVKKDGTLLARHVRVIADQGAYGFFGPAIVGYAGMVAASLYRVPNTRYEAKLVYTNKHFGGPFRGYGAPQVTFAIESQMDTIAEKLGMDGIELRLKNATHSGETTPCGWKITSCGFTECIQKAVEASAWPQKRRKDTERDTARGIGIACSIHISGAKVYADGDFSGSIVRVFEDGLVSVYKGNADIGNWSNTTTAQIVAESLGVPFAGVRVISMDTELTPTDAGSFASRVMFIHGNAAKKAAESVKEKLLQTVARTLEANRDDLNVKDGWVFVKGSPETGMTYGEAVKKSEDRVCDYVSGEYHYDPPSELINQQTGFANISAAYTFAAQIAEVEVDKKTGITRVVDFVAAQDVGRAINPLAVEGQIQGAIAQGIGYALSEQHAYKNGAVLNPDFTDYLLPQAKEMPPTAHIRSILVETNDPEGPFGAKGVGELTLNPTAAAITNALYDAIGVRFKTIPVTPEKILAALE